MVDDPDLLILDEPTVGLDVEGRRALWQDLVRGGLAALLGLEDDSEVVAEVGRGDEVAAAVEEHSPDVIRSTSRCPACPAWRWRSACRDGG